MPNCPTCLDEALTPTQPVHGLAARGCPRCDGLLLDLVTYRSWRERSGHLPEIDAAGTLTEEADTKRALTCPKCGRIMTKYRVTDESDNRVDFCASCENVWLDSGELALLHQPGLEDNLGRIFSQPWQRKIRAEIAAQHEQERLASLLGDDLERVQSFRDWLVAHPHRNQIMAVLLADADDGPPAP